MDEVNYFFLTLECRFKKVKEDLDLIVRLQEKDAKALSSLYDKYSGALLGVILRICKDEILAEELLQETFLKIWDKSLSYDPKKGKFFTWSYRIARNTALNGIRNTQKYIQNEELSVYEDKVEDENKIDVLQLNGSIKKLDSHHQKAIELVYFNGLTHREAHEEMGVPLGTFKSYVRQALKQLKKTYEKALFLFVIILKIIGNG